MNSQDFQNICETLHIKYDEGRLTDADIDAFADVVTNVLGRDDLRAEGSSYERLAGRINHDYENDIAMNPLLARMYELCRMYAMYRPRPLTEMERKEEQMEVGKAMSKKYPARISIMSGRKTIASCWWEDLNGIDEISEKVEVLTAALSDIDKLLDETGDPSSNSSLMVRLLEAFSRVGSGLDPIDTETISQVKSFGYDGEVPLSNTPCCGIVALDHAGVERNRERGGSNIKMDISARQIVMDAYTIYGLGFYKKLQGMSDGEHLPAMEELRVENVKFSFDNAEEICRDWRERLGDVFAIPGSKSIVGTKKPVMICR